MFELLRLGLSRTRSPEHYRAMQEYIARQTIDELKTRGVALSERRVVELAAGAGGYSKALCENSRSFLATDLHPNPFFEQNHIPFMLIDATKPFPFEAGSVDVIYTSSLIEHVARPRDMLGECKKALRKDGILYLSFPPFYSLLLVGGHMFKPFHLLGEWMSIKIYNFLHGSKIKSYATVWDGYGLYPLTISEVEEMIRDSGFEVTHVYTRLSAINTARLPWIFKDLATWHVCFIARA